MNKNIKHEIGNFLHQIISDAEHIANSSEFSEYGEKIKANAYKIDALITDSTKKSDIDISKSTSANIDLKQFSGLNVLIVDDVMENIKIMGNIFETLSCNIKSAISGEDAIKIFKDGYRPEIVCMDIVMPGMDGIQTTKELKLLGCNAYCMAVSALKNQSSEVVSLFDTWIPKPFNMEHIIGALSGYKYRVKSVAGNCKEFKLDLSDEIKEKLLNYAKNGAYSELKRFVSTLPDSKSKEFLTASLKKVEINSIIKSIN